MSSGSISFDRAVEYYDRTRALPPDIADRQVAVVMPELRERGTVLEIGVGTGRIAVTLDLPIVGLDLSVPMMEVLRTKTGAIPLVQGDATRLPFRDGAFGAAYAAHVFHLIPTWEAALAELTRVVRPGGVLLAVRGSGATDVEREMNAALAIRNRAVGAHTIEEIDDGARRLGLRVRALETITWTVPTNISEEITSVEQGIWSGMWHRTPEERHDLADQVRAWAIERFGSADAEVPATSSFSWHAYDVPS
jgi:demethylmenaquinone methyltransferase/2-methoxy-6-polyprenyl-1,4-benzoquinol methylase